MKSKEIILFHWQAAMTILHVITTEKPVHATDDWNTHAGDTEDWQRYTTAPHDREIGKISKGSLLMALDKPI